MNKKMMVLGLIFILFTLFILNETQAIEVYEGTSSETVRRKTIIETEYPYSIDIDLSSITINKQEKSLYFEGYFSAMDNVTLNYTNTGTRYLGITFNKTLENGWLEYCKLDDTGCVNLTKLDFTYLENRFWNGENYSHIYYTTFPSIPNGTERKFKVKYFFDERPNIYLMYFGSASTAILVREDVTGYIVIDASDSGGLNVTFLGTKASLGIGGISAIYTPYDNYAQNWGQSYEGKIAVSTAGTSRFWTDNNNWCNVTAGGDGKSNLVNVTCWDADGADWKNFTIYSGTTYIDYEASIYADDAIFLALGNNSDISDGDFVFANAEYAVDDTNSVLFTDITDPVDLYSALMEDGLDYFEYFTFDSDLTGNYDAEDALGGNGPEGRLSPDISAGARYKWSGRIGFMNFTDKSTPPDSTPSSTIVGLQNYNTTLSATDNLGSSSSLTGTTIYLTQSGGSVDSYWSNATQLYEQDERYYHTIVQFRGFSDGDTIYFLNSTSTSTIVNSTDYWFYAKNESGVWNAYDTNGGLIGEFGVSWNVTTVTYDGSASPTITGFYSYEKSLSDTNTIHVRATLNEPPLNPLYSGNATIPTSPKTYNTLVNVSFEINWTDINFDNATFQLGRPIGTYSNYTTTSNPPTQNVSTDIWYINFTQDMFGPAGAYNYTWFGVDIGGLENKTDEIGYTIEKANTSITLYRNGTAWAVDYTTTYPEGADVNATINVSTLSVSLLRNGTSVSNPDITELGVGVHNYTGNFSENENYTGSTDEQNIIINLGTPIIYSFDLNDSYININQSVLVRINSTDRIGANITVEVEKPSETRNYTTSFNNNYTLTLTKTELGDTQGNISRINITNIYTNGQNYTITTNSTTLYFDYGETNSLTSDDSPDPTTNAEGQSVTIWANYTDIENSILVGSTCEVDIFASTFSMAYSTVNVRYEVTISTQDRTVDVHSYTITCANSSYETQSATGTVEITSPVTGGPAGGGGGGPQVLGLANFTITPEFYTIVTPPERKFSRSFRVCNDHDKDIKIRSEFTGDYKGWASPLYPEKPEKLIYLTPDIIDSIKIEPGTCEDIGVQVEVPEIGDGTYEIGVKFKDTVSRASKVASMGVVVTRTIGFVKVAGESLLNKIMFGLIISPDYEKIEICRGSINVCMPGKAPMKIPMILGLVPIVVVGFVVYRLTKKRKYNFIYVILIIIFLLVLIPG